MKKFWLANKRIIRFVILIFIVWQLILCFLNFIASFTGIPYRGGYNYVELKPFNPPFFWNWANFDGIHYLDISRKGYGIFQQAFFPLYPKLIRFIAPSFGYHDLIAGIFISNFSLLISLFLFYKLIKLDYSDQVAKQTLVYFLIFPASFFLGMVYTESLFLMLVLGSFYTVRKKWWLAAGILGCLASNTRLVGIFIFPALLYEWWLQNKVQSSSASWRIKVQSLVTIFLVPLGLLSYMNFLWQKYGDPLMFLHVQPSFGGQGSGGKIILLYQVFWRYLKMILTTKMDPLYFTIWLELVTAILFLVLILLSFKKGIRTSYLIFTSLSYITPSLSGTFSSLPRYALVLFPCFIYIGLIKNKLLKKFVYTIFGITFAAFTIMYFRGYWVA